MVLSEVRIRHWFFDLLKKLGMIHDHPLMLFHTRIQQEAQEAQDNWKQCSATVSQRASKLWMAVLIVQATAVCATSKLVRLPHHTTTVAEPPQNNNKTPHLQQASNIQSMQCTTEHFGTNTNSTFRHPTKNLHLSLFLVAGKISTSRTRSATTQLQGGPPDTQNSVLVTVLLGDSGSGAN